MYDDATTPDYPFEGLHKTKFPKDSQKKTVASSLLKSPFALENPIIFW